MTTRLTQGAVDRLALEHPEGTVLYDAQVQGLRVVRGKRSSSFKLVTSLTGSGKWVTMTLGKTHEVSLRDARAEATRLRMELREGRDPRRVKSTVPTLRAALEDYFDTHGHDLAAKTKEWYRRKIEGPMATIVDIPLDELTRADAAGIHLKVTRESGPVSANGCCRVGKLLTNHVLRVHDLPSGNVFSRAVRLHKERVRDWAIDPQEMPTFWRDLDGMEDRIRRACWVLMLTTGLRVSNASAARWEELKDGTLFVPRAKSGRSFTIPLPRFTIQTLEEVRELGAPYESPWVFPSFGSKCRHIEQLRRTDEFDYAPHMMRHTFRSTAAAAGVSFEITCLLMDHANPHVSFRYITASTLMEEMRAGTEAVCAKLLSHRGRSVQPAGAPRQVVGQG